MDEIIQAQKILSDAIARATAEIVPILRAHFAPVFDGYPEVDSLIWGQWAPYFNDGEPCVFQIHYEEICRTVSDQSGSYWEREEGFEGMEAADRLARDLLEQVPLSLLRSFCEDGLLRLTRAGALGVRDVDHD